MSTYYECRLNKLTLDLSTRPDIIKWLEGCLKERIDVQRGCLDIEEVGTPPEIPKDSRCAQLFYNSFSGESVYDNELSLNLLNPEKIMIDFCLGNKNKDSDIEQVIALFSKYYVSGNIVMYDEINYILFNMECIKKSNININKIDQYYTFPNECTTLESADDEDNTEYSGKCKDRTNYKLFYEDMIGE